VERAQIKLKTRSKKNIKVGHCNCNGNGKGNGFTIHSPLSLRLCLYLRLLRFSVAAFWLCQRFLIYALTFSAGSTFSIFELN